MQSYHIKETMEFINLFLITLLAALIANIKASDSSIECEQCSKVVDKVKENVLEKYLLSRNELNLKLIFTDIPSCVVSYQPNDVQVLPQSCVEKISEDFYLQNITMKFSKLVIKCKTLLPTEPNAIVEDTMQPIFDIMTGVFSKCGGDLGTPVEPDMESVQQCIAKKFSENPTEDENTKGNTIFNIEDANIVLRLNFSLIDGGEKLHEYGLFPTAMKLASVGCDPSDSSSFGDICQCFLQEKLLEYKFGISFGRINCYGRILEELPLDKMICINNKNI